MRPGPFDDWQDRALDRTMRVCAALVVIALMVVTAITHCGCDQLGRVEAAADVAQYERELDACKEQGKAAHSYDVYEACAKKADAKHGKVSK